LHARPVTVHRSFHVLPSRNEVAPSFLSTKKSNTLANTAFFPGPCISGCLLK
jgi:hypothetical protein